MYTGPLCIIVIIAGSEYHLLRTYYVSRTLPRTMHLHHAMQPLLLHFPLQGLDTTDTWMLQTASRWIIQ